jgi:hypothetical protein
MRVTASRLSFLSAFLLMSIAVSVAEARNSPSPYLKGVTAVTYHGAMKDEGRCKIDWKAWNTAIEFVANQSTKLKLMTEDEHQEQIDEILDSRRNTDPTMPKKDPLTWTDEDFRKSFEIDEIINKRIWVPRLSFIITTIELESGCAAVIDAEVSAPLKSSTMISTGASVRNPDFSIWLSNWTLQGSHRTFSRLAIETSERIMKEFVNDWTASQNLP